MKTARGRVLRDTAGGEGLLSIEGIQYPFRLEGMWRSDLAPKANMPVDVEFDDGGAIAAIRVVDTAAAAREQAAKVAAQAGVVAKQAGEVARQAAAEFRAKGMPAVTAYAQVIGVRTLVAMALLFVGWFFLAVVSVDLLGDRMSATYYDLMRVLNNPQHGLATIARQSRAGAGFYGFVTIAVLLAPLLPYLLKTRRSWLAHCAPATWMLLAVLIGGWKVNSSISEAQRQFGAFGGNELGGMARQFMKEALGAMSMGLGFYLSIAAAGYLAFVGLKRYRAPADAAEQEEMQ
ncbi:MAG: hypothetical protein WBN32_10270 [Woeseia sp.]